MNILTEKTYIIAEIGVNHNGDLELAKKMILAAKESGADAVKFQTFTAQDLVGKNVPKVKYQRERTSEDETHFEMIRSLELSHEGHQILFKFCNENGIDFLSTPYGVNDAKFLLGLGVKCFKIASADIVDHDLLHFTASTGLPVILSTGMATLGEVDKAYEIFEKYGPPSKRLILLHCVSNYPCKSENLNLNVLKTLRQAFQCEVGYSDHSEGNEAALCSIALNSTVIEKHFTLDKHLPGPDHYASATAEEFTALVKSIRKAESLLGSPVKKVQEEEKEMRLVSRKSLTYVKDLPAGHQLTEADFVLKRPGTGIVAYDKKHILNRKLKHAVTTNSLADLKDVE